MSSSKNKTMESEINERVNRYITEYSKFVVDYQEIDKSIIEIAHRDLRKILDLLDRLLNCQRFSSEGEKMSYISKLLFRPLIDIVRDYLVALSSKEILSTEDKAKLESIEEIFGFDERIPDYSQYVKDIKLRSKSKEDSDFIIEECQRHQKQLHREYLRLVKKDIYGNQDEKKWDKDGCGYFYYKNIHPRLIENGKFVEFETYDLAIKTINEYARMAIKNEKYSSSFTGEEFELFCSSIIEENGYSVDLTKRSGDQGVDIIVDSTIGIQCKMYSNPVGNGAVQEIVAGLKYYGLQNGFVVTNTCFTKSCIELALINNIKCVHYSELEEYFSPDEERRINRKQVNRVTDSNGQRQLSQN